MSRTDRPAQPEAVTSTATTAEPPGGTGRAQRLTAWLDARHGPLLLGVLALAVAARLGYAFLLVSPQLTDDETSFWAVAGNLASGAGYSYEGSPTAWRPPAYTVAVTGLRAAGLGVRGVQAVQALLGAVAVLGLHQLAGGLRLPAWAALPAAAGAALYPPFVHLSSQVLSENLSLPLYAFALAGTARLLTAAGEKPTAPAGDSDTRAPSAPAAVSTGLLWGFAVLARPAVLPALGVAGLMLALPSRFGARLGRRVGVAALVGAAAAAVVLPWTVRNAVTIGGPVPVVSNEGFTLWVANRLDTDEVKDVFRDPAYPGLEDYGVYGREFPGILELATADGFNFSAADEAERDTWFREQARDAVSADLLRFVRRTALKVALALEPAPDNASREEATSAAAALALWVTSGPILLGGAVGLGVLVARRGRTGAYLAIAALVGLVGMAVHLPYVRYRVGVVDPILLVAAAAVLAAAAGALPRRANACDP